MKGNKNFDSILDECLERLFRGETIEQCLRSHPEPATELEPLLRMALVTKEALTIQPRVEFRTRAREEFRATLREMESKRGRRFFGWQLRWVAVGTVALVFLLLSGSVVAAGNSMPGEILYPVKVVEEQARLTLTPSALGKAELHVRWADRRVAEIIYLADKGDPGQVEQVAERLDTHLMLVAQFVEVEEREEGILPAPTPLPGQMGRGMMAAPPRTDRQAKIRQMMKHYAADHPAHLRAALDTAQGERVKAAVRRSIGISETGYKRILQTVGEVED